MMEIARTHEIAEIIGEIPAALESEAVPLSTERIETIARARGDVLHQTLLDGDQLAQTADELAQLADSLVQASAERSRFLSKVAHELRTPLTIAKGWISMLRYGELLPEQERIVKVVDQQIDELTRLVNDLLDLSRREADSLELRLEAVNLVSLVEQVAEHQREIVTTKGIQLDVRPLVLEVYACVDRGRLAQVLNNLISNASRYVPHNSDGRIELVVATGDTAAQISVRDNGIGIASEHLSHIFEPFYQVEGRQRGKSGLGLAVSYELVRAHGGKLTVESALGKGTTFHIWLRRTERPAVQVLGIES
jgi:signal transduction histidine kinase